MKNLPAMQETLVQFLGWEDPLEKGQATHSSILGFPGSSDDKESAYNMEDLGLIPGIFPSWEDTLEEGKATTAVFLSGASPWTRGAWQATVHRVAKSRT